MLATEYHLHYVENIPVPGTSARFFIISNQTHSNIWGKKIKTLISQNAISDCYKSKHIGEGQEGGNFSWVS